MNTISLFGLKNRSFEFYLKVWSIEFCLFIRKVVALKRAVFAVFEQSLIMLHFDLCGKMGFLGTFTTDTSGQLDVLGHDGDTLGVDGAQVGIFKKTNQVSLRGFLESHDGRRLETQVSLEVLGNFSDETLEGQLADQKFSGLLVTTDLAKSDSTGPITMGLLD